MKTGDRIRTKFGELSSMSGTDSVGISFTIQNQTNGTVLQDPSANAQTITCELDPLPGRKFEIHKDFVELMPPPTPSNKVCVCKLDQLVFGGCICGAMEFERGRK